MTGELLYSFAMTLTTLEITVHSSGDQSDEVRILEKMVFFCFVEQSHTQWHGPHPTIISATSSPTASCESHTRIMLYHTNIALFVDDIDTTCPFITDTIVTASDSGLVAIHL